MTKGYQPVFSREHDLVKYVVVYHHDQEYFPSSWTDLEIEDWLWRKADRAGKRVLRREISVKSRKDYGMGLERRS